jgi:hypothetical protein
VDLLGTRLDGVHHAEVHLESQTIGQAVDAIPGGGGPRIRSAAESVSTRRA